jgi:hypothetical protein
MVSLTSIVVDQFSARATCYFSDGFESGDFSAWNSGAGYVQLAVKHHGVYGAQFSGTYQLASKSLSPALLAYARIYVRFSDLPGNGNEISVLSLYSSSTLAPDMCVGVRNYGGVIRWGITWDTDGVGQFASFPNPITEVWYCVELRLSVTEGVGYDYELWVDGTSILTQSRTYSHAAKFDELLIGGWDENEKLTNYIDCVVVSDAYVGIEPSTHPSGIFKISVNSHIHDDYGLTYPVTYEFHIQTNVTAAKCYYRFSNTAAWSALPIETADDFFNGINDVRFDYVHHKAFASIGFGADSDEVYLKFTNENGNPIDCDFSEISKYYDNRRAAVVVTADDWDGNSDRQTRFMDACDVFQNANVWLTVGVITTGHWYQGSPPNWETIQSQLNEGFVEVASHSRTHNGVPYDDYDGEIGGSKSDIINNLSLPALYRKGEAEYVWAWIEPGGSSDATVRQKLGTYQYLADRATAGEYSTFSTWDSEYGLYNKTGALLGDELTLQQLNDAFDNCYSESLIYHMYFHPSAWWIAGGGNWDNGVIAQHLDHIKNKKDVWYVGLGALYAYYFVQERGIIQVEPESSYILTVSTVGSGSVSMNNTGPYYYGDVDRLTAVPSVGWSFSVWSGNLTGSADPADLTITGNMSVTATFTQNTYTLTVSVVGSGVVNLNNTGPYHYGDVVRLTAVPSIGWSFDHWSGDLGGSTNPTTILINGNKAVTATFTQNTYTLTVSVVGSGVVNLNNTGPYHYGDVVRLTAVPSIGWSFSVWSGNLTGSTNPTTITMTSDKTVTATFSARATVHLLLTAEPNQATYKRSQSVTFAVSVLNQLNPSLDATLTLTVTGPGSYYYFDFLVVNVTADAVGEYSFTWDIPNVKGTYVVEASLVPPMLTAYDAAWLEVT